MPLIKGYSRQTIAKNIKTELRAGRPRKQAIAIAYAIARRAALKHCPRCKSWEKGDYCTACLGKLMSSR